MVGLRPRIRATPAPLNDVFRLDRWEDAEISLALFGYNNLAIMLVYQRRVFGAG
jgi:hypothetical protein